MLISLTRLFETKRREMIEKVNIDELSSKDALKLSEELDIFINLLQKRFPNQDFNVTCIDDGTEIKLSLKGHLDYLSSEQLDIFLSSFRERFTGFKRLQIDLSHLSFIDSAGANGLYKLIIGSRDLGIKPDIIKAKGTVYEILQILGFFKLIKHIA
ncbi:STAS domain-containing protein [Cytobacillus firmus]|uniref:STAS domain-containing protein n=1 Tax=Cytobacillus firmus DS1 TaxID=1307436 RepID=W7L8L2_CYTFI|nr:STAS domain-containing protein [Cytobacillus firmus]EWG11556.1 hypothetical protein PBF_08388 [Cytobacillus firmus DS1]